MKQWYALYFFIYSYEFVIWPDCFLGHSCPGGICPESGPLVTDMQHYYHARSPTDDWHLAYMFLLVYLSVEVCMEDVFPSCVSTRRDPCVRVYAPLTLAFPVARKQNRPGATRLSTCTKRGGIWTDAWVCLHYWVVIWVAGLFNFHLYCTVYGVCHKYITLWP